MGQRTVIYSDLSGKEAPDGAKFGRIIVIPSDGRRGYYALDATDEELEYLIQKGTRHVGKAPEISPDVPPSGRKPRKPRKPNLAAEPTA